MDARAMKRCDTARRRTAIISLIGVCSLVVACAVGRRHTPDAELERKFLDNEAAFESLLSEVQADERVTMISTTHVRYGDRILSAESSRNELERLGFTRDLWTRYQQQLKGLGLVAVLKHSSCIEFRVDQGSIRNGDSYKGYAYCTTTPGHLKSSLDDYRISEADRDKSEGYSVSKPLKGRWYLYLYVNG